MDQPELTDFSGISGRVLRGSSSFGALITGIVLAVVLVGGSYALFRAGSHDAVLPFVQIVLILSLARFAVDGLHGDYGSLAFSSSSGSWSDVLMVSLRFGTLTLLWFVPLMLAGLDGQSVIGMAIGSMMGFTSKGALLLVTLYMLGTFVTPAVFLIVAVSADGFGDLFTPDHWRGLFGGRLGDLYQILALSVGALTFLSMLVFPLAGALGNLNPDLGKFVSFVGMAFLLGVWTTLMGRLCGFFAFGETGDALPSSAARADVSGPRPGSPAARPAPAGPPAAFAPVDSSPPPPPVRTSIPLSGGSESGGPAAPAPAPSSESPVEDAWLRFEHDAQGAIRSLEEGEHSHPSRRPEILHALCLMHLKTGDAEAAVDRGREALQVCQSAHRLDLLAQLVRELWPHLEHLEPTREQILHWGRMLVERGDLASAARAFARLVRENAEDVRPIKGLMKIADLMLHDKHLPAEAVKVYSFLLQACPQSPLAEHFRRGLDEARRAA